MPSVLKPVALVAVVLAACLSLSPVTSAISPDAAEIQLQMAKLLFNDGRYIEAFDAFEQMKTAEDPRVRREALRGSVTSALRLGDFSHAYDDAQILIRSASHDSDAVSLYGDSLWAVGRFEESEKAFQDALALAPGNPRALHGMARSLAARNKLSQALDTAQAALNLSPRDAEIHHTVGSIYEKLHRYEEAANAFSSYINLLPNKDRSAKAAWARAEVRFLRGFGGKVPLQIDPASVGKLHTIPFRVVNEKVIVRGKVNKGPQMDFVLDTGAEQTVISRETAARLGIHSIVNILSAGVGDLGVRELELTRLDDLEIGSLRVHNVPSIIKNPPLHGLPTREMESFSPLALGLSVVIDYDRQQLLMGPDLPTEVADVELPLRLHRLAMVPGRVDGGSASFILDTGGQVISISTDTASGLDRGETKQIPLKVYGASGWDRDAFLLPGVDLSFSPKIHYDNYSVVVLNLRAPSVLLGFRLGGIVGYRFLSDYRVAINLDKSVVQLQRRGRSAGRIAN
ncbi:MAG TPA: aspartyl protease family protein [Vicinamibacterales bacterium]|nr:aspartyl protease family protein [Vicinamibacterales bacterium]